MAGLFDNLPAAGSPAQSSSGLFDNLPAADSPAQPQLHGGSLSQVVPPSWGTSIPVVAANNALDAATFGLSTRVGAGAAWLLDEATGGNLPYSTILKFEQANNQAGRRMHPYAAAVGDVGGMFAGGGALVHGAEALGRAGVPILSKGAQAVGSALAGGSGSPLARIGQQAAVGAGASAASQMIHNGQIVPSGETLASAGVGAVAGPAIGKVLPLATGVAGRVADKAGALINKVAPDLGPALGRIGSKLPIKGPSKTMRTTVATAFPRQGSPSSKGWGAIAKKLGLKPRDLTAALNNYKAASGRDASIAEVLSAKQSGELRAWADGNTALAEALQQRRAAFAAAQPQQMGRLIGDSNNPPPLAPGANPVAQEHVPGSGITNTQTIGDLINARKAEATALMDPIRNTPVPLSGSDGKLLFNIQHRARLPQGSDLSKKLSSAINDLMSPSGGFDPSATTQKLTFGEADALRQALNSAGAAYRNPANPRSNALIANEFTALSDKLSGILADANPRYAEMMQRSRAAHHYQRGFKLGAAGNAPGNTTDAQTLASMQTDAGVLGHRAGIASHFANKAAASESGAKATSAALSESTSTTDLLHKSMGSAAAEKIQRAAKATTRARQALDAATPSAVRPPRSARSSDLAVAGAEAGAGMRGVAFARAGRWLRDFVGTGMPPKVMKQVGAMLTSTDPTVVKQGIAVLRKTGVTDPVVKQILNAAAAMGGAAAAQEIAPTQ